MNLLVLAIGCLLVLGLVQMKLGIGGTVLIRSLASIVIVVWSYVLVIGQAPDAKKETADKTAKATVAARPERQRDFPFPGGVDLKFLITELAREMDLNVLFDPESRLEFRKVRIELKDVTTAEALKLVLVQEGLYSEEVGAKTILVASRVRATSVPQIGVGTTLLTNQLAEYFGVEGGVLINYVRRDSPGSKAGLKAGDVIVAIDDQPVTGAVGLMQAVDNKKGSDFTLKIVRNRKEHTVSLRLDTSP
jgi:membrane-associated protease RseP (regulator of RpoE activity)